MLGHDLCFAAYFHRRRMIRELGDNDLAFVQLLSMMKPGVLTSGKANHLHAMVQRFDDKIIPF